MQIPLGPVILISGYRGLANNLAKTFAKHGCQLSLLVRREEALDNLRERFPNAVLFVGDVASEDTCTQWIEKTIASFGRIDCLINNAAITGPGGKLHELSFADYELCLKTNLHYPLRLCQLVLPHFLTQKTGTIINLSGGGACYGRPHLIPYAISKCALVRLTECLALEYPSLRFYAITPGALKTPMMEALFEMGEKKLGSEFRNVTTCMETGGEDPQKAAELAFWLFYNSPLSLNGKLISAVWDDYKKSKTFDAQVGWWTLRRVDDLCLKNLKSVL